MVTLNEAYVKVFTEVYPGCYSENAIEDDGGYLFYPKSNDVPRGERVFSGTIYPYVSKFTGAVSEFDILSRKLAHPKKLVLNIKTE